MARVITYSPEQAEPGPLQPTGAKAKKGKLKPDDEYIERIVKFIPGETLAFFVPASAIAVAGGIGLQVAVLVAAFGGNILWLREQARREQKKGRRVLPHYFWLSSWALLVWAFATNSGIASVIPNGVLFGIPNSPVIGVVLAVTVFYLPAVDGELASRATSN